MLNGWQRGRDHLDVEDRHEHAKAHQDEAEPGRGAGLARLGVWLGARLGDLCDHGAARAMISRDAARARFSARIRIRRTTALRIVKMTVSHGSPSTSGSMAISPITTA